MAKQSAYYTRSSFKRDRNKRRGSYYPSHFKNIKKSRKIAFNRVENGFIIKMDYYGNTTDDLKTAFYLVIEPDYTPKRFVSDRFSRNKSNKSSDSSLYERDKRYMHVFDLSFVPPAMVRKLVEFTKEVRVSNFIFSNTKFAFLDFKYSKRALYDALVPIMRDSYRTLIRNKVNIRNVDLIDYDFKEKSGTPDIKFIRPNLNNPQLKLELQKISLELSIDPKELMKALPSGDMMQLELPMWENMNRTQSAITKGSEWFYKTSAGLLDENYKVTKDVVGKEIEDMIPKLFKDQRKYAPVVLNYKGDLHLVYGEKLMQVCRVLAIIPTVYMIKV